ASKEIFESIRRDSAKHTMNEASCTLYCMTGLTFLPRQLSEDFRTAVDMMSDDVNDSIYQEVVTVFGTHYIYSMKMGSNFGVFSQFSDNSWEEMKNTGLDISAAASFNALIKAGVD